MKKLERERFEADLKEAHDVLAHMGSRLHDLERNDQSAGLGVEGKQSGLFSDVKSIDEGNLEKI